MILAAAFMPALVSAKVAAAKTVCVSNHRQAFLAMSLYTSDYDDKYSPVNYEPGRTDDPTNDRTWVQLLLPYAGSMSIFRDPGDYGQRPTVGMVDEDVVPNDAYARFYAESLRSDIGFNYMNLSPVVEVNGVWQADPRSSSSVTDPSKTILFVDSVWARTPAGTPIGGGSWLVVPPCRYESIGNTTVDTLSPMNAQAVFAVANGWSSDSNSDSLYGKAWGWHAGKMNATRADGSVKTVGAAQLSVGCNVQPSWGGYIRDPSAYLWAISH